MNSSVRRFWRPCLPVGPGAGAKSQSPMPRGSLRWGCLVKLGDIWITKGPGCHVQAVFSCGTSGRQPPSRRVLAYPQSARPRGNQAWGGQRDTFPTSKPARGTMLLRWRTRIDHRSAENLRATSYSAWPSRAKYVREGSVVRDAVSKQIVKHLNEVPDTGEIVQNVAGATARLKWMPSNPAIIVTAVALAAVTVTGVVVHKVKKQAERNMALPECLRNFGTSWDRYRAAIRDRRLDVEILDQFISDFDAVLRYSEDHGTISLDLSVEQGTSLADFVADYTSKLAAANSLDLADLQKEERQQEPTRDSGHDAVVDLRRNLAVQRKIFGDAA